MKGSFVLLTAVLASAACGGEAAKPATAPAPVEVTYHAKDFAFTGPSEITAGRTTFKLVNDGPNLHHMQIVRLDSGKTIADVLEAMKKPGPPPGWLVFMSGPNAPAPDGSTSNATLDLAPGNYAALCFIDIPDKVPHFAKGMITAIKVNPAAAGATTAAAPVADITLKLQDYQFILSTPITAGRHTFAVEVQPGQPHEVVILRLAEGKTADDLMKWMEKMAGPPPAAAVGGLTATMAGTDARFSAEFTAGKYVLMCFLPDAKEPTKVHFMKGMQMPFEIQ